MMNVPVGLTDIESSSTAMPEARSELTICSENIKPSVSKEYETTLTRFPSNMDLKRVQLTAILAFWPTVRAIRN